MSKNQVVIGRWYPNQPPMLPGETLDTYTNRLTGASLATGPRPYDHRRNRQCSIGYHDECSDRDNYGAINKAEGCGCPCHEWRMFAAERARYWNDANPVGAMVAFGDRAPDEPVVATTSEARVEGRHAVVDLDTFDRPVNLAWIEPIAGDA